MSRSRVSERDAFIEEVILMKNIKFSLAWQILFAMVLGILLGSYLHYHSDSRDWLVVNSLSPVVTSLLIRSK